MSDSGSAAPKSLLLIALHELRRQLIFTRTVGKKARNGVAKPHIDHLVLYGSLRKGHPDFETLRLSDKLEDLGPCEIEGILLDLGAYPGMVRRSDSELVLKSDSVVAPKKHLRVHGELYRIRDSSVIETLDQFERFNPGDATPLRRNVNRGSLYLRSEIQIDRPVKCTAYIYEYNGEIEGETLRRGKPVDSGDWSKHLADRSVAQTQSA